jgi:hypothetical protein
MNADIRGKAGSRKPDHWLSRVCRQHLVPSALAFPRRFGQCRRVNNPFLKEGAFHYTRSSPMREFRTVYNAPCRTGKSSKPGYVPTRIDVAVCQVPTGTGEAMLHPFSKPSADVAGLGGKPRRQNNMDTSAVSRHKAPQQNNLKCTDYFGAVPNRTNWPGHYTEF